MTGPDAHALEAALAPLAADPRYQCARSEASLEDVFMSLMDDNNQNSQRGEA